MSRLSKTQRTLLDEMMQCAARQVTKILRPWGMKWRLACRRGRGGLDIYAQFVEGRFWVLVGQGRIVDVVAPRPGQDVTATVEVEIRDHDKIRAELTERYGRPPKSTLDEILKPILIQRP